MREIPFDNNNGRFCFDKWLGKWYFCLSVNNKNKSYDTS